MDNIYDEMIFLLSTQNAIDNSIEIIKQLSNDNLSPSSEFDRGFVSGLETTSHIISERMCELVDKISEYESEVIS